ncbi:hypothetical protein CC2G_013999 [Coprinopsis cinerea AmutBmut pab1-1]|nr:hypothetical protein CC2G_013999 [Coprinopsis cinerea AmutBmut pab1-1]
MRRETSGGDPIHRGNHATYLREGHVIMTTKSLAQFTAQSLYLSNSFVVKQTDSKPDIKIDSKKFLEAFSFKNDEGEWEPIEDWTMAPQHPGSEANDYTQT